VGILSGDGLMLKAYKFFEDLEPEIFKACIRIFTHTGLLLCEGQQYDINFETQEDVTFDDYIRMITYKTGVLSASSFEIGALIAKADFKDAKAIFNFGKHIGIAFQIMDDYLMFSEIRHSLVKNMPEIFMKIKRPFLPDGKRARNRRRKKRTGLLVL
jgi:geranylgeranyl diphosphate synthase type II